MSTPERPRLRPYLAAAPDERDPRYVMIWDRLGLADGPRRLTFEEFSWLQRLDGCRTLSEIQTEADGARLSAESIARLVQTLDDALFLDGTRFRSRLADQIREPSCLGCYEPEPAALRRQIRGLFTGRKGPGLPSKARPDDKLRAALIPHIDYERGGHSFAWGFKEVFERTAASLFVIIGTSHYSAARFTLTRKQFKTPLGVVPTDQDYVDRLVGHYGKGLFDDELAHLPEHSIELEVVFLQYLYENLRRIRIVPLIVGPFHDFIERRKAPRAADDVGLMAEALRRTEAETPEPICYIISGDLAHIGPKFGDHDPLDRARQSESRERDQLILRALEAADLAGYFRVIADEGDSRRICGLPPTYTLLDAIRPSRGKVLHYDQYQHPRGFETVSFASVIFDGE